MKHFIHLSVALLASLSLCCAAKSGPHRRAEPKPDPHGEMFAQKCTNCHDLTLVEEAHRTKTNAEMKEILIMHKDRAGAEITEGDLKAFLELYGACGQEKN